MENPDLRKAMGMKSDQKGVRVRRVEPTAPESGCLQPSDIILSFDGIDIANDGTGQSELYTTSDYFYCFCFRTCLPWPVILVSIWEHAFQDTLFHAREIPLSQVQLLVPTPSAISRLFGSGRIRSKRGY